MRLILPFPMVTHSAGFVDPIHVNNEEKRWQNASLLENNADIKWLLLLAIYQNTNLRSAVEWLYCTNNWLSTPYSCKTFQSLSRGTRSYAFSRLTMHAKRSLPSSQNYSMIRFRVEIWFVVRRPRQCGNQMRVRPDKRENHVGNQMRVRSLPWTRTLISPIAE